MGYLTDSTIDWSAIRDIDEWLDEAVSRDYQDQPLAQDWARVAKVGEEYGEAIAELILMTGQNPRKTQDPAARERLLMELSDVVFTAILGMQHFTKNTAETREILQRKLNMIRARIP